MLLIEGVPATIGFKEPADWRNGYLVGLQPQRRQSICEPSRPLVEIRSNPAESGLFSGK